MIGFLQSNDPNCIYYPQYNYQYKTGQKTTNQEQLDLQSEQQFGIGFWMSYQPFIGDDLEKNPDSTMPSNTKSMFVFSYEFLDSEIYSLLFYVEMSLDTTSIIHKMLILTDEGIQIMPQEMNYDYYEGNWIFVYCYIDQISQIVSVNYYSVKENQQFISTLEQDIVFNSDMVSVTGSYRNAKVENQVLYLQVYPGIIYPVIINYDGNYFDNFDNFFNDCSPIPLCVKQTPTDFIPYNVSMLGQVIGVVSNILVQRYVLKGWIKKGELSSLLTSQKSLLLRITINEQYFDNKQIGDRLLYVMYYQDNIDLQQNGFSLQTYSYSSIWKPETYSSDESDTIYVQGEEYKDIITQWHYFQFEVGTQKNFGQPIYTVYYARTDTIVYYTWSKQIKHFTTTRLYFNIGGDEIYPFQFKGYLSSWVFNPLCGPDIIIFEPFCHYTCLKCKGISSSDCKSCPLNTLRVFSQSQQTCRCKYGYIDTPSTAKCLNLQTYNSVLMMQEVEILDKNDGYYFSHQSIICEFGYFKYNNTCIKCPYSAEFNLMNCADCILYPDIFSQNPNCTFKLNSSDENSVYARTSLAANEVQLYQIDVDLKIQLRKGLRNIGICQDGYFEKNNGECQECPINCQTCSNEFSCIQCKSKFLNDYNGECVYCEDCAITELILLAEGELDYMYCSNGQYLIDDKCYDCGNHCSDCYSDQCYRCDDQNYFITLDQFNCAKCSIINCQYCFQYIILSDQSIITSLDSVINFDLTFSEMKTGCALCDVNYFYSFVSNTCEPSYIPDCRTGVILDSQIKCLISDKRQDAVQQSICSDEQCLSCINNYSQIINSFCIICKTGYYSNFSTGECKRCPSNCLTCSHFNDQRRDNWKWSISAFYHFFIKKSQEQLFQNEINYISVICLSCPLNYFLSQQTCVYGCSDDCLDCQMLSQNHLQMYYFCNKCKSETFNLQRSVDPQYPNQCLTCPDYCLACYPRTEDEIKILNPFFNQTSAYRKYSHKCHSIKSDYQFISLKPPYLVSDICQAYNKCEKNIQISFYIYCDFPSFYAAWRAEKVQAQKNKYQQFQSIFYQNIFENLLTAEIQDYFNQMVITEITYNLEIIYKKNDKFCYLGDKTLNITNYWKQGVFALQRTNLIFWRSQKSQSIKIPIYINSDFTIRNFDKITFDGVSFQTYYQKYIYHASYKTQCQFINDYDPVIISFLNCEITQTTWQYSVPLAFTCNRPEQLIIKSMVISQLNILESKIFDFQPQKDQSAIQQIDGFIINNSNLTQTSVFMYNAEQHVLKQIMTFINVTVVNSNFSSSFFINTSFLFDYNIGELYLENIHLENLTLSDNSIFFKISNAISFNIKNFTVINVRFLDYSSLIICNLITLNIMQILNSYIDSGYFISVIQQTLIKRNYVNTNELTFNNISFSNNTYQSSNSFLYILQDQFTKNTFVCSDLFLDNNNYQNSTLGIQAFVYVSYKQSLIYIDCTICKLQNIQIFRGIGLPEISIINSKQLSIDNLYIQTREQYYKRSLHSSVECVRNYIYLDIPFVLYIGFYKNVSLNEVVITNTLVVDYQIIGFFGQSLIESTQTENIQITNSIFKNNLLIIINKNRYSSIIFIETQQKSIINLMNIEYENNLLNLYYLNTIQHSSTTLLVNAQLGQIKLDKLSFIQNIITNSSDSVLLLQAESLIITNSKYFNSNILSEQIFLKNLIASDSENIQDYDIQNEFPILSQGGSGYIEVNNLQITNTSFINSQGINGGGLYISTLGDGIIIVENCSFENTSTVLNGNQFASGGLIYVDSSRSMLNLTFSKCQIFSAYSRRAGGAIFIDPSRSYNYIYFDNLVIHSVFSLQHSFLSFSPTKQISITSELYISNTQIRNTESDFEKFIQLLFDLQEQIIQQFQTNNPLIYVQFSKFTMSNCIFDNIHLASLLQVEQGIDINLQNVQICNSKILQSSILKLSLRTGIYFNNKIDYEGSILLQNLVISNISLFTPINTFSSNPFAITYHNLLCPLSSGEIINKPQIVKKYLDLENLLNLNKNLLYKIITLQNFSIIEISNQKFNHLIQINGIKMSQIMCFNCAYGILSVIEFQKPLNLEIMNLEVFDNNCGSMGCLSIIQSIDNIDLSQTESVKSENEGKNIDFNTFLLNSIFMNNTANYGGACFISEVDMLINQTIFLDNKAKMLGGSIFYNSSKTSLLIVNSQIVNNSAQIGGGIYLQHQQLQDTEKLNLFLEKNSGQSFANNLYETPRFFYLSLNKIDKFQNVQRLKNSTTIIEEVKINPYQTYFKKELVDELYLPSGISISSYKLFNIQNNSYVPYNFSFRLQAQNLLGEKITDLENTNCQISAEIYNKSEPLVPEQISMNNVKTSQFISQSTVTFDIKTGDYNLDNFIIYFNPFQNSNLSLQLAIQCNSFKVPYYNQLNQLEGTITNNILLVKLKTFTCQLGEYFNKTSGGCVLCDIFQNQYSVTINSTKCTYKDETKISAIQPAIIKLKPYFWRAFYHSEIIEECKNQLSNCEGGWQAGNPSCALGHIGALCEQCDLYNIKGFGEFAQNQSYQCSSCQRTSNNIMIIVGVIIWTLISVFLTVTSTIKMIDEFVAQLKLKPLGFFTIVDSASTSVLMKVFTNYFQIISSISSFQLSIPSGITVAVKGIGNPIESMAFSLDCYLKSISSIQILYFRIIWGLVMAGIYIFLFFLFHILENLMIKTKLNITFVTTTLVYVYIYLSPNLVSELSKLISYRNISGKKWIAANVSYLYNTDQHRQWLLYFVTPTFFIIGIFIPLFFLYIVSRHRLSLNTTKTRKVWGYLYNEYKLSTYYWEIIKIIQKELIILILIYYEDIVAIKACLIFFLLHLYSKLTTKFKPYLTENLNQIDSLSNSVCKFSIVIAQSIYLAQNFQIEEVVWPFYIVLAFINCFFIGQMILNLLFAYFEKLYELIDKVKALIYLSLPYVMKKNKVCLRVLRNTTERKQTIRHRFQQVRKYLIWQAKLIIQYKKQNNMGLVKDAEQAVTQLNEKNLQGTLHRAFTTIRY